MKITVNGDSIELTQQISILDFLEQHNLKPQMVVVEHNRIIISRDKYGESILADGDNVEIVQMMAGG